MLTLISSSNSQGLSSSILPIATLRLRGILLAAATGEFETCFFGRRSDLALFRRLLVEAALISSRKSSLLLDLEEFVLKLLGRGDIWGVGQPKAVP